MKRTLLVALWLFGIAIMIFPSEPAFAVPSFSRQTGASCAACHTSYPGLTAFGRQFKLNGYTSTNLSQIKVQPSRNMPGMSINQIPNLSLIVQTDESYLSKALPGQDRTNANFPKEFGVYYAGRITPHLGTFLQLTYDSEDGISMDMSDIRYTGTTGKHLWGVDINNGPTFEDPWNSTPGYGWPYVENSTGVDPLVPFLASEDIMTNVVGIGAYDYWNNKVYGYLGVYQSAKQGDTPAIYHAKQGDTPATGDTIRDAAPYWRFAWTPTDNLEIGTFGFYAKYLPDQTLFPTGNNQHILDTGLDSQYQIYKGNSIYTFHARYVREKRSDITNTPSLTTHFVNMDANWFYQHRYGLGAGLVLVRGDRSNFYSTIDQDGFKTNSKPDTNGLTLQADYLPWENVRLSLQYTAYLKFNGSSKNYNADGRNASDNNAVILNALLGF
ncbi:MAG: cytochrome c [bacterium]|nr:MAG: cytochrome c [bacterium]